MRCGRCKQPIRGDEQYVTDHYKCAADMDQSWRRDLEAATAERDQIRDMFQAFHEWAQGYLDSGRWAGHDRADAIKTELLERDAQVAQLRAEVRAAVEAEREACARLAETYVTADPIPAGKELQRIANYSNATVRLIAAAIRQRGATGEEKA